MGALNPRAVKTTLPVRAGRIVFLIILAAYLVYAAVYIFKTSFVVDGERYFVLFDDAMISMRYARNLANGDGLVWNPGGERVEGYTNPLWVVFMAVFHLFPIPAAKISLLVQASGALFLAANLYFVYRIAGRLSGNWMVAVLASALTAFYQPLNNWGLQGMEVSLLVLMTSAAAWMARSKRSNAGPERASAPGAWVVLRSAAHWCWRSAHKTSARARRRCASTSCGCSAV